eukprot:TRINITY_DN2279_c0_g1_i5.p1 TRINITY_DN2279_c0_g1~~TRINITY_DN2279_c0_g1_i5.p1  ORF type:complete len:985 (+),score=167.18 TRINITY_DN2279_c0_g1_i5:272-3226(+)
MYLLNNNPKDNKSLMRSGDELAKCEIARREMRKQEALDRLLARKKQEWQEFAVSAASMRTAQRLSKDIPSTLTKAQKPMTERRVFFKHSTRKRSPSLTPAVAGADGEDPAEDDEDSEEEIAMGVLDVMQSSMSEALVKRRGQHTLIGLLCDMIKSEHDPFAAFVALLEPTKPGSARSLRVIGGMGNEVESLIGTFIQEDGGTECFRVMDNGVIITQDEPAASLPEEIRSPEHSWFLVPVSKPVDLSQVQDTEAKAEPIGIIAISTPRREATTIEVVTAPKPEGEEIEEEEEDEEQLAHNEILSSLTSAASIFGHSLCEAWATADEPQLHRATVKVSELVDAAVERRSLSLSGLQSLCYSVGAQIASVMEEKSTSAVSCVVGLKDPRTEMLTRCVQFGPHWSLEGMQQPYGCAFSEEELLWEVVRSGQQFQADMLPRNRKLCGMTPHLIEQAGAPEPSYAVLVHPLILTSSDQTDVIGVIAFVKNANNSAASSAYNNGPTRGFSNDDAALAEMAAGPLAAGCEAVSVRDKIEDMLGGLLRRYCNQNDVLRPGEIKALYEAPAVLKFKRQSGGTSREVVICSDHRGALDSLGVSTEFDCLPVKPEIPSSCNIVFGSDTGCQSATTQQLDEVKEVCTIAMTHICNRNHKPLLQVQHGASCAHRWMLTAEALTQFHRLQVGRLTESEVLELEPRLEPCRAISLVIDAVLLLLGHQTCIDMLPWQQRRTLLGAPLLQQVIDFDPTSRGLTQETVRSAVRCWKEAGTAREEMCAAAVVLHEWMGAALWARKEMRAVASITRQSSLQGLLSAMESQNLPLVQNILTVDHFNHIATFPDGKTILHKLAEVLDGNTDFTALILSAAEYSTDQDTFMNAGDADGNTALHMALSKGQAGMVQCLLDAGADIELLDSWGNTALVLAASQNLVCVQVLLDARVDVNGMTLNQQTALDICEQEDIRQVLIAAGAQTSAALTAVDVEEPAEEETEPQAE